MMLENTYNMEKNTAPVMTQKRPTTRRGFFNLIAAIAASFGEKSQEYHDAKRQGYRHRKHNGRTVGAFGGKTTAKSHRSLYVS